MKYRVLFSAVLIILIITCPWWVYLPVLLIGTLIFPFFLEGIFWAFIIDAAYGNTLKSLFILNFPIALLVSVLIIFLLPLREHLRVHA